MAASGTATTLSSSLGGKTTGVYSTREEEVFLGSWLKSTRVSEELEEEEAQETGSYEGPEDAPLRRGLDMGVRGDRIAAMMLRPETLRLLELLDGLESPEKLYDFLVESSRNLHAFADLATEDLIAAKERRLVLTALAERVGVRLAELG